MGIENKAPLTEGYYLGIRRSTRNFSFSLPNLGKGPAVTEDMDTWFMGLNSGKKVKANPAPNNNPAAEKSTSFSGWYKTDNAVNLSTKGFAAPEIYKAAGGGDPHLASEKVKLFKKKATAVLTRCSETQEAITEATAAEINTCACVVHEMKVVILCVSGKEFEGSRFDPNTGKWYKEKTLRKFYSEMNPSDELLATFAAELADPDTTINAEFKLIAVRSDKVTPRTGTRAYTSKFSIRRVSDEEFMATDAKLLAAVQRIKAKLTQSSS